MATTTLAREGRKLHGNGNGNSENGHEARERTNTKATLTEDDSLLV